MGLRKAQLEDPPGEGGTPFLWLDRGSYQSGRVWRERLILENNWLATDDTLHVVTLAGGHHAGEYSDRLGGEVAFDWVSADDALGHVVTPQPLPADLLLGSLLHSGDRHKYPN